MKKILSTAILLAFFTTGCSSMKKTTKNSDLSVNQIKPKIEEIQDSSTTEVKIPLQYDMPSVLPPEGNSNSDGALAQCNEESLDFLTTVPAESIIRLNDSLEVMGQANSIMRGVEHLYEKYIKEEITYGRFELVYSKIRLFLEEAHRAHSFNMNYYTDAQSVISEEYPRCKEELLKLSENDCLHKRSLEYILDENNTRGKIFLAIQKELELLQLYYILDQSYYYLAFDEYQDEGERNHLLESIRQANIRIENLKKDMEVFNLRDKATEAFDALLGRPLCDSDLILEEGFELNPEED